MVLTMRDRRALRDMRVSLSGYIAARCWNYPGDKAKMHEKIARIRDSITHLQSPSWQRQGGKSAYQDKMAAYAEKLNAAENDLKEREAAAAQEMEALCDLLDEIPVLQAQVIHRRIIGQHSYGAIANDLKYSESYIRKTWAEGMKKLTSITDERAAMAIRGNYRVQKTIVRMPAEP